MKVILTEDVPKVGAAGQIVEVKRGFARNFLFPRNLAVETSEKRLKAVEHQKLLISHKSSRDLDDAKKLAQEIEALSLTIARKAGDQDKLFGSVTDMDLEKALNEKGIKVTRKMIHLDEPIKLLGVFQVTVKPHPQVEAKLKLWVIKED